MVKLGDRVKDNITGFVGVATCRAEYLTGCIVFEVTGIKLVEGKVPGPVWFDEARLVKVPKQKKPPRDCLGRPTRQHGGPQDAPSSPSRPPASHSED